MAEVAVTVAKVEVEVVAKAAVAVEEAEEMAVPVVVVALVCSFWHVLRCKGSKTEKKKERGSYSALQQHYVIYKIIFTPTEDN